MALKVKELREELEYITIHPEEWDQGLWAQVLGTDTKPPRVSACGSFGCLAGNKVIHNGDPLNWFRDDMVNYDPKTDTYTTISRWLADDAIIYDKETGEEIMVPIEERAKELFDLTQHQADILFDGDNTLDDLWRKAEEISGGEIDSYHYKMAKHLATLEKAKKEEGK